MGDQGHGERSLIRQPKVHSPEPEANAYHGGMTPLSGGRLNIFSGGLGQVGHLVSQIEWTRQE